MYGRRFTIVVAGVCALAGVADAQIKTPDCGALASWMKESNFAERERLNQYSNASFSKPVIGEGWTKLFGKPAKSFTQADVTAARQAVDGCEKAAAKAKDKATTRQFTGLEAEIARNLGPVLALIEKSEAALPGALDQLAALPPSLEQLRVIVAVRRFAEGGGPAELSNLYGSISQKSEQALRAIYTAVAGLPDGAAKQKLLAKAEAGFGPSREQALKQSSDEIAAAPATVEGLRVLQHQLDKSKGALGKVLPAEDLASLDKTAAARREEIEQGVLTQAKASIDALPTNVGTLAMLNQSGAGAGYGYSAAGLPPPKARELEAHAIARRNAIADAVLKAGTDKLAEFPASYEGLVQLDGFQQNYRSQVGPLIGGTRLASFDGAVKSQAGQLAKGALPEFEKRLGALPDTRDGIATLDGMMQSEVARLARVDPGVAQSFGDPAAKRRAAMVAVVEKEEARLEAKALSGQRFATPNGLLKIEFRDRTRAYVTAPTGDMVEASWEQDGKRVIVRVPNSNMVLERQGGNLVGGGWVLRPVASN